MNRIPTPKEFFGRQPGDDRVMIHWNELCAYYAEVAKLSDRVELEVMGKSTEGNDFLMLYVSSPENLGNMEKYRKISMQLSDPRGLSEDEINALADKGKAIVMQGYGLHSNETGGPQMVPLMLYELATSESERIKKILSEVIFIISPCSEPDGEIVFCEWYKKYFGTKYEGAGSPYIRHNLAGHSNNRDAQRESVIESKHLNDIIVRRFMPQIFQDHHHQCPDENRMSISPKVDPIFEPMCPLVHRETATYGTYMAMELSRAGRKGIVAGDPFFNDFPVSSFYGNACLHNIAGMLTENADVRIATPDYIHIDSVRPYHIVDACSVCPDPWEGGWWHLRDVVDQMYIASMALLDYAATNRWYVLRLMADKALYQTKRGAAEPLSAYIIPKKQNDASAREHLLYLMANQNIEMHRLKSDTAIDGKFFEAGSVYIPLAQPKYALVKLFLSETPYTKHPERYENDGKARIRDSQNLCYALTMGVHTENVPAVPSDMLCEYKCEFDPEGEDAMRMIASENLSYKLANRMLTEGVALTRDENGRFIKAADGEGTIRRSRIALHKQQKTANSEEGFTRNLLRLFGCDHRILWDYETREVGVPEDVDVLIIPGDPSAELAEGDTDPIGVPKEYRRGVGTKGREHLVEFVERGGRLIAWEKSCDFVNKLFRLGLRDLTEGKSTREFFTGGSQLNAVIAKKNDPLTWGMPESFTLTHSDGPVLVPSDFKGNIEVLARIAPEKVLKNGLIYGEDIIAGKPCMLRAKYGKGEIILYTFNPQFRVQQDGTFKLLLNALFEY